jgi:hypothetical protein
MSILSQLAGKSLLLTKPVAKVEKSGIEIKIKVSSVVAVAIILCVMIGLSLYFYRLGKDEVGRLIIDLAIALFSWVSGKGIGEKAGLLHNKEID